VVEHCLAITGPCVQTPIPPKKTKEDYMKNQFTKVETEMSNKCKRKY
jgi:hypothetical protein